MPDQQLTTRTQLTLTKNSCRSLLSNVIYPAMCRTPDVLTQHYIHSDKLMAEYMQKLRSKIKALSIHEPWASAIALGHKCYETRDWKTNYRGLLAIHAAKKRFNSKQYNPTFVKQLAYDNLLTYRYGELVCLVDLVDCIPVENIRNTLSAKELAYGNYDDGRFAFEMELVQSINTNMQVRGQQGLFNITYGDIE
jgi:hypothetical protein